MRSRNRRVFENDGFLNSIYWIRWATSIAFIIYRIYMMFQFRKIDLAKKSVDHFTLSFRFRSHFYSDYDDTIEIPKFKLLRIQSLEWIIWFCSQPLRKLKIIAINLKTHLNSTLLCFSLKILKKSAKKWSFPDFFGSELLPKSIW